MLYLRENIQEYKQKQTEKTWPRTNKEQWKMIKHCALKLWPLCQWVNYYSVLVQLNIAFYLIRY